jgi:hypothetical protein
METHARRGSYRYRADAGRCLRLAVLEEEEEEVA